MKAVIKGAVVGGVIGLVAPVALAVGNEFLWSRNSGGMEPRICFAERLWNLQRIQVKHAPGCKNKILESTPQILLVSVLGGSLLGALSLLAGKAQAGERKPRPSLLSKPQEETIETPKRQEPVASKPPSEESVGKGLSEGFDLNHILRMSAIGGAVALVGFGVIKGIGNIPDPAWTGGEGVESGGGGSGINRLFGGKTQRHYNVITGLSSIGTNNDDSFRQERFEKCLARVSDAISQEDFNRLLDEGAEVVSQSEKSSTTLYYYSWDYNCFYVSYIVKQ